MSIRHHDEHFAHLRNVTLFENPGVTSERRLADLMGIAWYAYQRAMHRLQSYL